MDTLPHYHNTNDELPYRPPLTSRASRAVSMRSHSSFRGMLTVGDPPRTYLYESNLEARFAQICLANRSICVLEEQPPAITYVDDDGKTRQSVLDFRAVYLNGAVRGYAVKPENNAERHTPVLRKLAAQTPAGFAQSIKLISERHLDPVKVANAKLILWARRHPVAAHDETIRGLAKTLSGAVTIGSLVERSKLGGSAFRSVVRLVDLGELVPTEGVRIDYATLVRKGSR